MKESEDIRVSVKAVIVKDNRILAAKKKDSEGFFYTLPGGGQEHSENMAEALNRECLEEISVSVKIKRPLFIRDYIGKNHEFPEHAERNLHHIEIMFDAEITGGTPANGILPDTGQLGMEWLDLGGLENLRLYPKAMIPHLKNYYEISEAVYLGDVN